MDLFYLKESGFKSTGKVKRTSNSFKALLLTGFDSEAPVLLSSFKCTEDQLPELRYFKEPPTVCELNESERMSKIRRNREDLMARKKELEAAQGEKDEILSRVSEQQENLRATKKSLSVSQANFEKNTQSLVQAVENYRDQLQANKTMIKTLEIDLESKSLNNQKLLIETNGLKSELASLISTIDSHTNLLHKTQSAILSKAAKFSFNSNTIQSLLSQSQTLHQQYQADLETKYKLEKEIEKFNN